MLELIINHIIHGKLNNNIIDDPMPWLCFSMMYKVARIDYL